MKTTYSKITVTITRCNKDFRAFAHTARVRDRDVDGLEFETLDHVAVARAVRLHWGQRAYWVADSGLRGYGQIGEPADGGGTNLITGRMRLDVTSSRKEEE